MKEFSKLRIGQGYDVHRLVEGRDLVLGGVTVPHTHGLLGHSDADVLCHAVMDALLGAAGLGDIGQHFPDTSANFAGISSIALMEKTRLLLYAHYYNVINIDATLIAQAPKLAAYRNEMAGNIARAMQIDPDCVNIKFTTEEGLGFTGAQEGIAAQAVCLLHYTK